MTNRIKAIISRWRGTPNIAENVVAWRVLASKPAEYLGFPEQLSPLLIQQLRMKGISALYAHQATAFQKVADGFNIAIVSGTASGKTLCYNLPVVNNLIHSPEGKALYLFPTKALAQDQLTNLRELLQLPGISDENRANIYDGDTPQHIRSTLRRNSSLILTNRTCSTPVFCRTHSMECVFALRFVVIDEMHACRVCLGHTSCHPAAQARLPFLWQPTPIHSHLCNDCQSSGAGRRLIEKPVWWSIRRSPGEKHWLIYNHPLSIKTGIRRSMLEGTALAGVAG